MKEILHGHVYLFVFSIYMCPTFFLLSFCTALSFAEPSGLHVLRYELSLFL